MRLPRFVHRAYAQIFGYFWLPCPLCGVYFGGHEWKGYDESIPTDDPSTRQGICSRCARSRHSS